MSLFKFSLEKKRIDIIPDGFSGPGIIADRISNFY